MACIDVDENGPTSSVEANHHSLPYVELCDLLMGKPLSVYHVNMLKNIECQNSLQRRVFLAIGNIPGIERRLGLSRAFVLSLRVPLNGGIRALCTKRRLCQYVVEIRLLIQGISVLIFNSFDFATVPERR